MLIIIARKEFYQQSYIIDNKYSFNELHCFSKDLFNKPYVYLNDK